MPRSQEPPENAVHRTGRLLVAENNAALREYLVAVLRSDGHEVAAASTSEDLVDALAVSFCPEIGSGAFDLVIVEERLMRHGHLKLLGSSGARGRIPPLVLIGAGRASSPDILDEDVVVRLSRPLDVDSLRAAVRCLVQSDADASAATTTTGS